MESSIAPTLDSNAEAMTFSDSTTSKIENPVWWVVHTRPRCEKKMDDWFAAARLEHYLPVKKSLRIYESKKVTFLKPLFPGYAFGSFPALRMREVYQSDFAARLIVVENQPLFLAQMNQVRTALEAGGELELCPYLDSGVRVRITAGKFRGMEGQVTRMANKRRVILSVDLLQRSVALEVEPEMVMVIGS